MQIQWFRVFNYKRFRDSGPIRFEAGINVLVGQNDAGKTALVEALGLRNASVPHRSLLAPIPGQSRIVAEMHLSSEDLRAALAPRQYNLTLR